MKEITWKDIDEQLRQVHGVSTRNTALPRPAITLREAKARIEALEAEVKRLADALAALEHRLG